MPDARMPAASTEVALREPRPLVHPTTGEVLDLANAATDALAAALTDCRALEDDLRVYKRNVSDEVLRRMDHARTYTAHLPGLKLTGDGPLSPEYNGTVLWDALTALAREGALSNEAVLKAVKRETVYTPMKGGVKALLKVPDERVAAAVKAAEIPNHKQRAVRVSRS